MPVELNGEVNALCSQILGIIAIAVIIILIKQAWVTWLLGLWPWKRRR